MKNLPNYITLSRIMAALAMVFTVAFTPVFFALYLFCGITDVLDGFLARKMNAVSHLGQILDSLSDFVFLIVAALMVLPLLSFSRWLVIWIFIIAGAKVVALVIGFLRYHKLMFLHTFSNKLTGFLLFCFPLSLEIIDFEISAIILASVASFSAVEDVVIAILSQNINLDIKSAICLWKTKCVVKKHPFFCLMNSEMTKKCTSK